MYPVVRGYLKHNDTALYPVVRGYLKHNDTALYLVVRCYLKHLQRDLSVSRCQRLFKTLTSIPLYISLSEVI